MPFKVRGRLVGFMNYADKFPCHFDYQIGEEFTCDGATIEGRICPGVMLTMVPTVCQAFFSGNHTNERVIFKYSGLSAKDPSMKEHDGIWFRPLAEPPENSNNKSGIVATPERPSGLKGGGGFGCAVYPENGMFIISGSREQSYK